MAERKLVQCRAPFVAAIAGRRVSVAVGDLYYADDPLVTGREKFFGDIQIKSTASPSVRAVETATAAPGSRRAMSNKPSAKATKPEEGKTNA